MKYFGYKEEYVILSQMKKRKVYDFKFSIKNNLYNIITKTLLIILFISLIATIFLLDIITSKETYITLQNGNITTYLTKEMVDQFNYYTNTVKFQRLITNFSIFIFYFIIVAFILVIFLKIILIDE